MARVIGVGGIFFKAKSPGKLGEWYRKNLGVEVEEWGGATFRWREAKEPRRQRVTVWSPFAADTKYFKPSKLPFMVNFIVDDLDAVLARLKKNRVKIDPRGIEASEFGRFAWVMDPGGLKLELWEPPLNPKR